MSHRVLSTPIITRKTKTFELKPIERSKYKYFPKPSKPYVPAKSYVHPEKKEEYKDDHEKFWSFITKLRWRDKGESICAKSTLQNLMKTQLHFVITHIHEYAKNLKDVINPELFADFTEENKNNFLYHIVAKGSQFYNACIIDPDFCLYLLSSMEFQSLYTYMADYRDKIGLHCPDSDMYLPDKNKDKDYDSFSDESSDEESDERDSK